MRKVILPLAPVAFFLLVSPQPATATDARQRIDMPDMMREHMLGNMRDHLRALQEIQAALATNDFAKAADVAEQRLGMSSLEIHGAAHMAPYMPKPMQDIGTEMHRAASRFARVAQEASVKGDMPPVFDAFSRILRQCVACHESYRAR
jgi:cytochrome c556